MTDVDDMIIFMRASFLIYFDARGKSGGRLCVRHMNMSNTWQKSKQKILPSKGAGYFYPLDKIVEIYHAHEAFNSIFELNIKLHIKITKLVL